MHANVPAGTQVASLEGGKAILILVVERIGRLCRRIRSPYYCSAFPGGVLIIQPKEHGSATSTSSVLLLRVKDNFTSTR